MPITKEDKIRELLKLPRQSNIKYLYKYRSMQSTKLVERLENLFINNEIYLSSPTSFNDPFECRPNITIHKGNLKRRQYIKKMIQDNFPFATKKEKESHIKKAMIMINNKEYQKDLYEQFIRTIGIYSLTAKNDDLLMWSHYSDGHRGICIEFDAAKGISLFGQALEVHYAEEYPIVNTMDFGNPEEFRKALLTKSNHWEYEREWRILKTAHNGGPGIRNFQADLLTGVILGTLISHEHKDMILDWISKYPTRINVYQAKINETKYKLDIEPI
jgi:hypothetical protein